MKSEYEDYIFCVSRKKPLKVLVGNEVDHEWALIVHWGQENNRPNIFNELCAQCHDPCVPDLCVTESFDLKGPKHEIFASGFFTQIGGLWLGELGTGEKN